METGSFRTYKGDQGVSIALYPPLDYTGEQFPALNPPRQTFFAKKNDRITEEEYEKHYGEKERSQKSSVTYSATFIKKKSEGDKWHWGVKIGVNAKGKAKVPLVAEGEVGANIEGSTGQEFSDTDEDSSGFTITASGIDADEAWQNLCEAAEKVNLLDVLLGMIPEVGEGSPNINYSNMRYETVPPENKIYKPTSQSFNSNVR